MLGPSCGEAEVAWLLRREAGAQSLGGFLPLEGINVGLP